MQESVQTLLPSLIAIIVPLVTAIGVILYQKNSSRNKLKELDIKDRETEIEGERVEIEKHDSDISAARNLADILTTVVNPLSQRVALLEEGAIKNQMLISDLNCEILELKRTIHQKDIQIEKLSEENIKLTNVTNEQEIKIRQQEIRIAELESELKTIKRERQNDCT